MVEGADRLLPREEPFAGDQVRASFEKEGISVVTSTLMTGAERQGSDGPVTATLQGGRRITAEAMLVAVGRRPNTGDIGLDSIGIEPRGFLDVDERLRVKGADGGWLYAVGDVNGLALFTHMGKYQGRLAGDVILARNITDVADHKAIPRVTFTDPQVAAVGPTEAEARETGINVKTVSYGTGAVAGAYTRGKGNEGTSQIVVDEDRGVIVGATFTGPDVQEMLHAATIAVVGEVPLQRLWHAVPSFPTVGEVWLRLLEAYGL